MHYEICRYFEPTVRFKEEPTYALRDTAMFRAAKLGRASCVVRVDGLERTIVAFGLASGRAEWPATCRQCKGAGMGQADPIYGISVACGVCLGMKVVPENHNPEPPYSKPTSTLPAPPPTP